MNQIGLIGLGTMGAALARNLASKNYKTAVFNRTYSKTQEFIALHGNQNLTSFEELKDFVESLEKPRKIILMVNAGDAVDQTIEHLKSFLEDGDILIDCGNSNWKDTLRRQSPVASTTVSPSPTIHFIGCGVSGGEEGALLGPSIMPGGDPKVITKILPILQAISAKDFEGKPCVTNVGLAGAGHFVKMVHNGIEYAMMQGISEIYDILRSSFHTNEEIHNAFKEFNQDELKSFLLDITVDIFETKDKLENGYLIDKISDKAGAKGTGKWTIESALDLGVAAPNISEALNARILSARNTSYKLGIYAASEEFTITKPDLEDLKYILQTVFITSYLQGLNIIDAANKEYNWNIDIREVLRIWQGGCIIRSQMLKGLIFDFYTKSKTEKIGFILEPFHKINTAFPFVPKLVISATLNYILVHSADKLPSNLIQAQRDHFGAHTYGRIDKGGAFSGGWKE